jgi:hypothetical protein
MHSRATRRRRLLRPLLDGGAPTLVTDSASPHRVRVPLPSRGGDITARKNCGIVGMMRSASNVRKLGARPSDQSRQSNEIHNDCM